MLYKSYVVVDNPHCALWSNILAPILDQITINIGGKITIILPHTQQSRSKYPVINTAIKSKYTTPPMSKNIHNGRIPPPQSFPKFTAPTAKEGRPIKKQAMPIATIA